MELLLCETCNTHYHQKERHCPHCAVQKSSRSHISNLALLLGITQAGCFPIIAPKYGVPATNPISVSWTEPPIEPSVLCGSFDSKSSPEQQFEVRIREQLHRVLQTSHVQHQIPLPENMSEIIDRLVVQSKIKSVEVISKDGLPFQCLESSVFANIVRNDEGLENAVQITAYAISQNGFVPPAPPDE